MSPDQPLSLPPVNFNLPNMSIPELDASGASTLIAQAIDPTILWLVLLLSFIFMIIMTLILRWHWKRYTLNTKTERKMITLYYAGLGIGFFLLLATAIVYTFRYNL